MAKVLVLYHSVYGHIETMAQAAAEGVRENPGSTAEIRRVPETVPEEVLKKSGAKLDQSAAVAKVDELPDYDAILFGTPTRFGNMSGQMRSFLDQTGGLWVKGSLIGKPAGVFTSSNTQHGGQESTILSFLPTLMHLGMIIVGLPYSEQLQMGVEEVRGGSPYGASTIAGNDGSRRPSAAELSMARFQGRHIAQIASKLAAR